MTARDKDRQRIIGADPNLMPVYSGVQRLRLWHLVTGSGITIDPIDPDPAWIAEGNQ